MAKVEVDILKKGIERREVPVRQRNEILQDIKHVLEQEALEKDMKPKKPKMDYQLLFIDPGHILKGKEELIYGLILKAPEGIDSAEFISRLSAAAHEHNATPKGRKFPVDNLAEACEAISPKILKEFGISVTTKIPLKVTTHDGKLTPAARLPD